LPSAPTGTLLTSGSDLPPPLKRFRSGIEQGSVRGDSWVPVVQIAFRGSFRRSRSTDGEYQYRCRKS
jgi:hypothetical protein